MVSDPAQLFLSLRGAPTCCPCHPLRPSPHTSHKEPGPAPPHPRWVSLYLLPFIRHPNVY